MSKSVFARLGILIASVLFAGCDQDDATGIRLTINADGTARVRVSRLAVDDPNGTAANGLTGARCDAAAHVSITSAGTGDLEKSPLGIWDISVSEIDSGPAHLLILTFPRGEKAAWVRNIAPTDEASRLSASKVLDPEGKALGAGKMIKIVIDLPVDATATGFQKSAPGVLASKSGKRVTIEFPVATALGTAADQDDVVLHVSY